MTKTTSLLGALLLTACASRSRQAIIVGGGGSVVDTFPVRINGCDVPNHRARLTVMVAAPDDTPVPGAQVTFVQAVGDGKSPSEHKYLTTDAAGRGQVDLAGDQYHGMTVGIAGFIPQVALVLVRGGCTATAMVRLEVLAVH